MFKKNIILTGVGACIVSLYLCGCNSFGNQEADPPAVGESSILANKDGSITAFLVESFGEDYYNQEELNEMVQAETENYNKEAGEERVHVEKVQEENGMIQVVLRFAAPEDYAAYKGTVLFVGTIEEAAAKGYDLNIVLHNITDESVIIDREQIFGMKESHILITDEPVQAPSVLDEDDGFQPMLVETFGKVLYVSDGIKAGNDKNAVRIETEVEGLSYIIFK